ncbi:MAG: FKBP-type peptidyl-prolyl cis-trans isomerase [Saprospiraceae bacterium]|nr:FKBP-type peptidyl-prolyl cis-trans isomerase [Saprospiraceae bacterium]
MNQLMYAVACAALLTACSGSDQSARTDSGYEYVMLHDVPGETAKPGDYVFVWTNFLVSGDSSLFNTRETDPEPAAIPIPDGDTDLPSNMSAVQDVLQLASIGDSIRLIYPVDSFDNRPPALENEEYVWYDLTVVDIMDNDSYLAWVQQKQEQQAAAAQQLEATGNEINALLQERLSAYKAGTLEGEIQRTPSGLGYLIEEEGEPGTTPAPGERIKAHYYGVFAESGEMFDNSYRRGRTYDFNVGEGSVIKGWDEGFALINKGGAAILFIPPALGYGETGYGSIPANAELIFHVRRAE